VNIVQVLGVIMAFEDGALTPEVIEDILGMEEGEVRLVLQGLSSLIAFKEIGSGKYLYRRFVSDTGRPYFLHASFWGFLVDSSRFGRILCRSTEISEPEYHTELFPDYEINCKFLEASHLFRNHCFSLILGFAIMIELPPLPEFDKAKLGIILNHVLQDISWSLQSSQASDYDRH